jgi:hypothetical protein
MRLRIPGSRGFSDRQEVECVVIQSTHSAQLWIGFAEATKTCAISQQRAIRQIRPVVALGIPDGTFVLDGLWEALAQRSDPNMRSANRATRTRNAPCRLRFQPPGKRAGCTASAEQVSAPSEESRMARWIAINVAEPVVAVLASIVFIQEGTDFNSDTLLRT